MTIDVDNFRHSKIGDFCSHICREEDIIGGKIAMNEGRIAAVEIAETENNIIDDGVAYFWWHDAMSFDAAGQVGVQLLHHENGACGITLKVDTEKLNYVRMVKIAEYTTFSHKSLEQLHLLLVALIFKEEIVNFLSCTF